MLQNESKQAGENLESTSGYQRRRLTILEVGKLMLDKLAALVWCLIPPGTDDVHIQIGRTQIRVRVIKSPYNESQRRALTIATAHYLVRSVTMGTEPEIECDLKRSASITDPSEAGVKTGVDGMEPPAKDTDGAKLVAGEQAIRCNRVPPSRSIQKSDGEFAHGSVARQMYHALAILGSGRSQTLCKKQHHTTHSG